MGTTWPTWLPRNSYPSRPLVAHLAAWWAAVRQDDRRRGELVRAEQQQGAAAGQVVGVEKHFVALAERLTERLPRQSEIDQKRLQLNPLLAAALPFVGHFQTRNKGTVCGSIAHADPASEIPLALALLDGEVVLRSRRGTRVLAAGDFQQGMLTTAREPDELITAVRFPIVQGGVAFREVARRHGDFAIVAVAALADGGNGIRLGVAGMAERPAVRRVPSEDALQDAIERLAWELEGYEDIHASARMRRDLLRRIGPVVAQEAVRCAA